MRIVPEVEAQIRRVIRDARAKDPLITVGRIERLLEQEFNRGFSYQYVAKVVEKVEREAMVEIDRTKIEQRLKFTRENYRMMREELLKIVYWTPEHGTPGVPKPLAKDRVEAAKVVVMLDLAILNAEAAAGMYKKPIDVLAREVHYEPLPGEVRAVVIAASQRGGLLPKGIVEQTVPKMEELDLRKSS
jgi:hypothetical protein